MSELVERRGAIAGEPGRWNVWLLALIPLLLLLGLVAALLVTNAGLGERTAPQRDEIGLARSAERSGFWSPGPYRAPGLNNRAGASPPNARAGRLSLPRGWGDLAHAGVRKCADSARKPPGSRHFRIFNHRLSQILSADP